jgi:hypothetical protein
MYRVLIVTRKDGTWTWQASYTADTIPDTQAILRLDPDYVQVSVWEYATRRYVA